MLFVLFRGALIKVFGLTLGVLDATPLFLTVKPSFRVGCTQRNNNENNAFKFLFLGLISAVLSSPVDKIK